MRWWPAVVLACLPAIAVLVSAMVAAGRDPIADSDAAVTEIWVRTALDGDALVGPYSRFGWHHPGPTWFYLAAPLYLAFGRSLDGLAVAAAAVMVASIGLAVWIVGRVEGGAGAWVVGLTLLGWTVTVGTTWFDNHWNPLVAIGPTLVVGIAAAALAAGRGWCLPLVVGFGSLAIQTHMGSAPAVVGMAAPAMIALALGGWRSVGRRPAGVAIVTLAVLWLLPLWEQLTSSPGNVTELIRFARTSSGSHALADIAPQLGPQLTLLDLDIVEDSIGPGFDADAGWWTVGLGVFIVALAVLAYLNHRRRRPFDRALCAGACLAAVLMTWSSLRTEDVAYTYLSVSAVAVGAVAWCAISLTVARELSARWTAAGRRRATEHLVAVVVTLSLVVTLYAVLPAQRARLQAERAIPAEVSAATGQLLGAVGVPRRHGSASISTRPGSSPP